MRFLLRELVPASTMVDAGSAAETLRLLDDRRFDLVLVSRFFDVEWEQFLMELLARAEGARVVVVSGDGDPAVRCWQTNFNQSLEGQ